MKQEDIGIVTAREMAGRKTALEEMEAILRFAEDTAERLQLFAQWKARWLAEGYVENLVDTDIDKSANAGLIRAGSDRDVVARFGAELLLTQRVALLKDCGREGRAYRSLISVVALRAAPRADSIPPPSLRLVTT